MKNSFSAGDGRRRVPADFASSRISDGAGRVRRDRRETSATLFPLQRLLAKDDDFLDLLEACADEAQATVKRLTAILRGEAWLEGLDEFLNSERRERTFIHRAGS